MLSNKGKLSSAAVLIVLLVWGCTPFRPAPEHLLRDSSSVRLDVPYVPQAQDNDCGPAALASLFRFYGQETSLEEITREIYLPVLNRTLLPDMENFARDLGFETLSGRGDVSLLKQSLEEGRPVIVLLEAGPGMIRRPHYIIVTGYASNGFLAHAGVVENVYIDFEDLDRRWKEMNNLYLMIIKPQSTGPA